MSPIKFRAWDTDLKKYFLLDKGHFHVGGRGACSFCSEWIEELISGGFVKDGFHKPKILEQFTGLLDKHGNEIYEGDIVRSYPKFGTAGVVASVGGCSVRDRIVIWLNDEARFSWQLMDGQINSSGFSLCKNNSSILEVIGTIHDEEMST